ncbi:DUF1826 domain-containing protein [Paucihalobacter sp.]|uniref:DUF1826 domain-containing protein n=1 Tax=Paucihalobacter sp. TaxID=2850405 RepID=UPI003D161EB7
MKNIAIYKRTIAHLKSEIKILCHENICFKYSGSKSEILEALINFTREKLPNKSLFIEDISETLNVFEAVSRANSFQLLLDTISTDMCTKFHADVNHLRLLCTYAGPGTLWIPDGESDSILIDECNKVNICQVNTGNIALLKGKLYPKAKAILHRSPEIEKLKQSRLLLKIDIN